MKSLLSKIAAFVGLVALGLAFSIVATGTPAAFADGSATSISISPVNKILSLEASSVYEDSFTITNNGSAPIKFEAYAAPYSYNYSEENDSYSLGFSTENTYTQLTRWVTFESVDGEYTTTATYTAEPESSVEVHYRITTPDSIPGGGQYAVLFARTISEDTESSGIRTEASPGLVVYGRSTGETVTSAEVSDLVISKTAVVDGDTRNLISASAKVKNTGNIDFMATGKLVVTDIFGNVQYETPSTGGRVSIIPEVELKVTDVWEETPFFGLFNASWTVNVAGESDYITQLVLIMPAIMIVFFILLLTIVIVWIIIMIRKRKERRSKFRV